MSSDDKKTDAQLEMCKGPTGFILIFLAMVTVYIMFNMDLRLQLARAIGKVLFPLIGFDLDGNGAGDFPIVTLLLGAFILVAITTSVRHFQTDWIKMASNQKKMKVVNKAMRKAKMKGDVKREKEISKYQQEMMGLQQSMMMNNFKTMIYTLLIVILIFTWIWGDFIERLDVPVISTPWNLSMNMTATKLCCTLIPFPKWLFVYMVISVPLGLIIQHGFKIYSFKKRLAEIRGGSRMKVDGRLKELRETMAIMDEKVGFSLEPLKIDLRKAEEYREKGRIDTAERLADSVEGEWAETLKAYDRTADLLDDVSDELRDAEKAGLRVKGAKAALKRAEKLFDDGKFKDAVKAGKKIEKTVERKRRYRRIALNRAKDIKASLYDMRKFDTAELDRIYDGMERSVRRGNYKKAIEQSKIIRKKIDELTRDNEK